MSARSHYHHKIQQAGSESPYAYLSDEHTCTTNSLDLVFSFAGEELGFDNNRLVGKCTLAKDLEVSLEKKKKKKLIN